MQIATLHKLYPQKLLTCPSSPQPLDHQWHHLLQKIYNWPLQPPVYWHSHLHVVNPSMLDFRCFCFHLPFGGSLMFSHLTNFPQFVFWHVLASLLWPAEAFGMPFVPPYLGGGDFLNGANFAVGGATALNNSFFRELGVEPTWTPHSLDEQMQWFKRLLPSIASTESGIYKSSEFLLWFISVSNHYLFKDLWTNRRQAISTCGAIEKSNSGTHAGNHPSWPITALNV